MYIYQSLCPLDSVESHYFQAKSVQHLSGGASTSLTSFRGTAFEGRAAPSRQQGRVKSAVRSNIPCFSPLLLLSLSLPFYSILTEKNLVLKSAEEASAELVPSPTRPIPVGLLLSNLVQLDSNFHWKSSASVLALFVSLIGRGRPQLDITLSFSTLLSALLNSTLFNLPNSTP